MEQPPLSQTNREAKKQPEGPSIGSSLAANFFFPGMGSWRMGEKVRGGIIMFVMVLCVIMTTSGYFSLMNRQIDAALDTQDDAAFDASFSKTGSNWWLTISTLVFIYSFVDVFLIYTMRKNTKGSQILKR